MDTSRPPNSAPEPQPQHGPGLLPACPGCHVPTGELHADWCGIAWCAAVGRQRGGVCDAAHGCRTDPRRDCRTPWTGLYPGFAECRELGWYAHLTPNGWASCDPATPGAIEDLNRLLTTGTWDPQKGRYIIPAAPETAAPEARLPESVEREEEGC